MNSTYRYILAIALLLAVAGPVAAQNNFFTDAGENKIVPTTGERIISPQKFRTLQLNLRSMRDFLWSLPAEENFFNNRTLAPVLTLPMPDGSFARFRVWESSIQEPGLAEQFPEIRTFAGQGIDDPAATIRFDYNPYFGFSAQILSPNGRIYIDPYARRDVNHYISYYHRDNTRAASFTCRTEDRSNSDEQQRTAAGPCAGTQLRRFRLAVSCTGEYAQTVGGGAAGPTHAAIVTSVNRVTGVYEVELSVRLLLVANNNLVEFLVPGSDPYANDGNNDLNIITGIINTAIGSANYDIGHLFCTNEVNGVGAGVALLGVVCNNSLKGNGLTGRLNPTGDGYDIDYVAHEMGHQFNANHTFNSNTCASSGGSYEPGGGTTIMAYAGICGNTENIQPNSDPIFHALSFDQISTFVSSGSASACAVLIATGNTLPVITSMGTSGLSIPVNTPFELTATATDANGDALTYNWEGWDVGTAGTWPSAANSTTRPLFRTRLSRTSGSRTFPDIRVIAANYPGTAAPSAMDGLRGEVLPAVARTMKFRLTVRDNRAGGGGVVSSGSGCQSSTAFQVFAVGTTPFAVTVPNGGESYTQGSVQTVTWNTAGTTAAPFNVANVMISLSTDGGLTYPTVLLASTPNDGSQAVTLPNLTSTTARIKVEALGNIFFDISNANFNITAAAGCTITCPTNITVPNTLNQCGAVVTYPAPTTSGSCGTLTAVPASGSFFPVGTTTVTVTSTAGPTCTFTITVQDTQVPSVTCPSNMIVSNTINQCGAVVNFTLPTATDNCPGVTVVANPASGSFFPLGTTTVTVTAADNSPNSPDATCTFTVTVQDTQAPLVVCPSNITVTNTPGQCGTVVNFSLPAATDNCAGVTVTASPASGTFFPVGTTTVTVTAADSSPNSPDGSCTFTVTVQDTEAPAISCPSNIIVSNDPNQCGAVVSFSLPAATDNCPGGTTVTASPASGSFFPVGSTVVTVTAADNSPNSPDATCTFTVTVRDTEAPVLFNCPSNIVVPNDPGQCGAVVVYTMPTVSDNCTLSPLLNASPVSGSFFPVGTTTVTITAADFSPNSPDATCSFTITVTSSVSGSISGTAIVPQHPVNTSPVTFTGNGGVANYTFTYTVNGGPVQIVSTTGGSNSVTVSQSNAVAGAYTYNLLSVTDANGCSGTITAPTFATITVGAGIPDLTNSQFFSTTQIANGGIIDEVIGIRNVGTLATSAPVVFTATNYAAITGLSANSNPNPTVTIGFTTYTLSNANWNISTTPSAVTFTSNPGVVINPGSTQFLGIRINRVNGANGTVTHSSTISAGTGGGDAQVSNNSISNILLKN